MKMVTGGVTAALGFKAHGLSCGIKKSGKPDLALIASDVPAPAASVFTRNSIKAAPIIVSQEKMRFKKIQAIIVNSGNANCFTGSFGLLYARRSTELIAELMNINSDHVLVASTGIIGRPLAYKKIEEAAPRLVAGLSPQNGKKAAQAILTTDKKIKETAVEFSLGGKKVTIGACAKGSGMIQPNMATMLAFITTDCAIAQRLLQQALCSAVEPSFNSITVDGCMSTNDMVTVMASGLAGNKMIDAPGKNFEIFQKALHVVCLDLAKKIVLDAEGATKFIEVMVTGAATCRQAKAAALAIANSNLVKTAAYGCNPNWGRVAAAVGSLGLKVSEKDLKIRFSSFAKKNITMTVDLNLGKQKATVYTCDLTLEYVKINGKYN